MYKLQTVGHDKCTSSTTSGDLVLSVPVCTQLLLCCYIFKYEEIYVHCLFVPSMCLIEFANKLVRLATVSCIARSLCDVTDTSDNNIG